MFVNSHGISRGDLFWRMKSAFQQELESKLSTLLEPVISEAGAELVELQFVQRKSSALLRVLVDKVGGISLDECAEISRRTAFLLETSDPIEGRYTLEVSSPGLDRPLTTAADFRRKIGEQVRLTVRRGEQVGDVTGEITKIDATQLTLSTADGERDFQLADVVRGKIIF